MENIKLVVFDFNKTLVNENTWYDINIAMGVTPEEDEKYLRLFETGKITYQEWWTLIKRIYDERGEPTKERIDKIISNYTYVNGAKEIVSYLKEKGYEVALITGSTEALAELVAKELDIHMYAGHNQLIYDTNHRLTRVVSHGNDFDFKVDMLWKFCNRMDIDVTQTVCIGDGDNDTGLFELSGHGVTFKGSRVEDRAWKVIEKLEDLKEFL
ncbi:HAD family phosphatase [candidate division WWE3 bacterium]|uniref:phosphoserine phosphatase n=1 Tax=candidate division WWE3 bacterium TaxID=2053526 RepID=A0A955LVA1_UNCKA|nr:HAD family phosphatase [candidate division WWE3 bacterium]